MRELELRRRQLDNRTYELDGYGTLRLERFRRATVDAGGRRLHLRENAWVFRMDVTDDTGVEVGSYVTGRFGRPGALRLGEREWSLRRVPGLFSTRYELLDAGGVVASIRSRGLGRPTLVELPHETAVDPEALLVALFVVQRYRMRAAAAAA